jgi:hypothetical protein
MVVLARVLSMLGDCVVVGRDRTPGEQSEAIDAYKRGIEIFMQQQEEPLMMANALCGLGHAYHDRARKNGAQDNRRAVSLHIS